MCTVPLSGTLGGVLLRGPDLLAIQNRWILDILWIFSMVAFALVLWVGIILGLDGILRD